MLRPTAVITPLAMLLAVASMPAAQAQSFSTAAYAQVVGSGPAGSIGEIDDKGPNGSTKASAQAANANGSAHSQADLATGQMTAEAHASDPYAYTYGHARMTDAVHLFVDSADGADIPISLFVDGFVPDDATAQLSYSITAPGSGTGWGAAELVLGSGHADLSNTLHVASGWQWVYFNFNLTTDSYGGGEVGTFAPFGQTLSLNWAPPTGVNVRESASGVFLSQAGTPPPPLPRPVPEPGAMGMLLGALPSGFGLWRLARRNG